MEVGGSGGGQAGRKAGRKEKKEPRFRRRRGINQRWRENTSPLGPLFSALQARGQIVLSQSTSPSQSRCANSADHLLLRQRYPEEPNQSPCKH